MRRVSVRVFSWALVLLLLAPPGVGAQQPGQVQGTAPPPAAFTSNSWTNCSLPLPFILIRFSPRYSWHRRILLK